MFFLLTCSLEVMCSDAVIVAADGCVTFVPLPIPSSTLPQPYISQLCDHVTGCKVSSWGSGPALFSVAVLCEVRHCVHKPQLNVTGGGWTEATQAPKII